MTRKLGQVQRKQIKVDPDVHEEKAREEREIMLDLAPVPSLPCDFLAALLGQHIGFNACRSVPACAIHTGVAEKGRGRRRPWVRDNRAACSCCGSRISNRLH